MLFQAMETLIVSSSSLSRKISNESREEYKSVSEEAACVHFRYVCDCSFVLSWEEGRGEAGGEQGEREMIQKEIKETAAILSTTTATATQHKNNK